MEIHQACEMFLLWSHCFQHLSGPGDTAAAYTGVGVGVQLCPLQMSNQTTLFFFRRCLYLSRGRTKKALNDTCLAASDKIHVVCAVPSRCPQVFFSPSLFPVPCPSRGMAFSAQPGSRVRFLFFTPLSLNYLHTTSALTIVLLWGWRVKLQGEGGQEGMGLWEVIRRESAMKSFEIPSDE